MDKLAELEKELLADMKEKPVEYKETVNNAFEIDSNLRTINIPITVKNIGVESDDDVKRLEFTMPKQYGEFDLSQFRIRINYMNANGDKSIYLVEDKTVTGDNITFSWLVGRNVTKYKGQVKFIVCLKLSNEQGQVLKELNTTLCRLEVLEGLEVVPVIDEKTTDIIEQLLKMVEAETTGVVQKVTEEGNKQVKEVQKAAQEIVADREQIQKNTESVTALKEDLMHIDPPQINGVSKNKIQCLIEGSYYNSDGEIAYNKNWLRIDLIPVKTNDIIYMENAAYQYICFFDIDKRFLSAKNGEPTPSNYEEIIEDGVAFVGCNVLATQKNNYKITVNKEELGVNYSWEKLVVNEKNIGNIFLKKQWKNKKYISHGDSITWYDGNNYPDGTKCIGYQSIMNKHIEFAFYDNQGWSGHSMADGTANGDGCVTRILSLNHAPYDLCTIACGTNDFKLNVPLGTIGKIGDASFDRKTFYGAYRTAIEHLLTQKPTLRIVLFTPLQRDNEGYDVNYVNSANHKIIDYVNAIKEIGKMYGLPVCDMYSNSGFTKLTLSTYTIDGLHPNNAGFERMGNYATQFINSIGC